MSTPQSPPTRQVSTTGPLARWRRPVTPAQFRVVAIVALAVMAIVVITGAAVRLTGSGMGCDTWPNCSSEDLLRFGDPNQAIEQANRIFSTIVGLGAAVVTVVAARWRDPYRGDLWWLSWGLVAGVLGQIPLGGLTVLVHLHPAAVGSHFLLSMALILTATILVWRAGQPAGPRAPKVGPLQLNLSRVATLAAAAMFVTGPVVTGSGPHAGDAEARRFGYSIPDVTRIHSINMWIFLVCVVVLLGSLARARSDRAILRRGQALLVAIVVQGAIGYSQYELGIPEWLVLTHIAGAMTVLILTTWFHLGLSGPVHDLPRPPQAPSSTDTLATPGASR